MMMIMIVKFGVNNRGGGRYSKVRRLIKENELFFDYETET